MTELIPARTHQRDPAHAFVLTQARIQTRLGYPMRLPAEGWPLRRALAESLHTPDGALAPPAKEGWAQC